MLRFLTAFACIFALAGADAAAVAGTQAESALPGAGPRHAIAMHGDPRLPADFAHFPYADPAARKGGRLILGLQGTFDSLNPYIVRGLAPQYVSGFVIQSLLARSLDEPFTLYAQLAESVETPPDRSFVVFRLNPKARFSDGSPVRAEDVLFSWAMLKDKARPGLRMSYAKVTSADILDERTIRFDLAGSEDRELPLMLGLMPIFPKARTDAGRFDETSLVPPIGSGPYIVTDVRPGHSFSLKRNPDYWGADLPVSRGLYNFDEIRVDFYRDANSLFEAFKAGLIDLRIESDPTRWATGYNFPAVRSGRIVRESLPVRTPQGMSGFVINTRRAPFQDVRVREALGLMFDFDWINRNLYFGSYSRTASYFEASDLSARGRPASEQEREWLQAFPGAVRPDIMDGTWQPPTSDGSGRDRNEARAALRMFRNAGFKRINAHLVAPDGRPFAFEILVLSRQQERLALIYADSLKRIGIDAKVRMMDEIQFWKRLQTFDFDMTMFAWAATASPGNEQFGRWSRAAAHREGSLNFPGVDSAAVDAMIEHMLEARSLETYTFAVRALDRTLMSGFYTIPLFYLPNQWIARVSSLKRPQTVPLFGTAPELYWRAGP